MTPSRIVAPMTLAELPADVACTIKRVGEAIKGTAYQLAAGIAVGNPIRVLARYPEHTPRFVEVEVAHRLVVTLPLALADDITLECECA